MGLSEPLKAAGSSGQHEGRGWGLQGGGCRPEYKAWERGYVAQGAGLHGPGFDGGCSMQLERRCQPQACSAARRPSPPGL